MDKPCTSVIKPVICILGSADLHNFYYMKSIKFHGDHYPMGFYIWGPVAPWSPMLPTPLH